MPWCEDCSRFYNPNTLTEEGECPDGHQVGGEQPEVPTVPWHFWVLVIAVVLYLGWRLIQGIAWLIG